MRSNHLFQSFFLAAIVGVVAAPSTANAAPDAKAKDEVAPLSFPSAETFVYRELSPLPLRLHIFKPADWKVSDKRPVFVFFFGGGWTRGTPERSAGWAKYAAGLGFVGIAPDHRTNRRFNTSPLESVADGRSALRWIQDHAK